MRYYRHRRKASQKAKTIFFRILFVLTAAVVITGMAILTGKALLNKVEKATEELESSVPPSGNAAGRVNRDESDLAEEAYSSLQVFAAGLDLPYHETEDSLFARIHTIAESCDTVSVKVTGQSGLLYTSPALSELVRMPAVTGDNPLYDRLSLTVTAAKARNLRLSAVMTSSLRMLESATAALVDSTIAAELYAMGFQEILLTDILPYDADTDTINNARRYLQSMQNTLSGSGSFSVGSCQCVSGRRQRKAGADAGLLRGFSRHGRRRSPCIQRKRHDAGGGLSVAGRQLSGVQSPCPADCRGSRTAGCPV